MAQEIQRAAPQAVVKHQQQSAVLTVLRTSELKRIYELMSTGKALKEMNNEELVEAVRTVSKGITVMTGSYIDKGMEMTTLSMMKVFLHKSFGFLTVQEILYAFEYNSLQDEAKHIKHFNRPINIDFVGRIIKQYIEYRSEHIPEIGNAVRYVNKQLEDKQPEKKVEVSDDDRKQMLNMNYQQYVQFPTLAIMFHERMYEYAEKFGLIEKDLWQTKMESAISSLRGKVELEKNQLNHQERATVNQGGKDVQVRFEQKNTGRIKELESLHKDLAFLKKEELFVKYESRLRDEAKLKCVMELYRKSVEKKLETLL